MEVAGFRLWAPVKIYRLLLTCDQAFRERKSRRTTKGEKERSFFVPTFQRTKEEGYLISKLELILTKDDLPVGHMAPAQIV